MDFTAISPYLGPVGVAALLALYGLASLAKSSRDAQRDNAELFARLRAVEERLTRLENDVQWIRGALEKLEGAK
jgi:hypothetical protein